MHKSTRPMLAVAAESIAAVSGVAATVVDVLHGRALRHYAEGLRQYLVLRLGSEEEAIPALEEVRAIAAAWPSEKLVAAPGVRANLYRLARDIAARRRASVVGGPAKKPTLPWRRPARPSIAPDYLELLAHVRTDMDAELLELRYARELPAEEIAFVVGDTIEEVQRRLDEATTRAQTVLGPNTGGTVQGLGGAILEAFALEPSRTGTAGAGATSDDAMREPLAPGTVIGHRYAVEKRVGMGAFGDVYRANDTEVPGHVVALKLLHQTAYNEEARAIGLRELRLIASVFHPSVVQFKDHGWFEQRLWFVMPWYEGETLEARINREPLTRPEARRFFEPLARALATIHAAGIRHQDVKPDNIFLARIRGFGVRDEDHEVLPVLLDLGVAAKEAEMVVAGTPTYFAPEVAAQFSNAGVKYPISSKADVFSLALSLRNALDPDTQEDVPAGAIESFIERRAIGAPEAPRTKDLRYLDSKWKRWLAVDPDDRPTADQLADELAALTAPEERRKRIVGTLKWLAPLIAAGLAVFGTTAYALQQRAQRQELEARRARQEAAALRGELGEETEQRRQVEAEAERLRGEYESSNLSRQDLTTQLAHTEARLRAVRSDFVAAQERARVLRTQLTAANTRIAGLEGELGTTRERLAAETRRAENLAGRLASTEGELGQTRNELQQTRNELTGVRAELEGARQQIAQANTTIAELRREITGERQRAQQLEQNASDAQDARSRAEQELAAAQRRINDLERELAAERARNRAGGGGGGGGVVPQPDPGAVLPPPDAIPPGGVFVQPGPGATPIEQGGRRRRRIR